MRASSFASLRFSMTALRAEPASALPIPDIAPNTGICSSCPIKELNPSVDFLAFSNTASPILPPTLDCNTRASCAFANLALVSFSSLTVSIRPSLTVLSAMGYFLFLC